MVSINKDKILINTTGLMLILTRRHQIQFKLQKMPKSIIKGAEFPKYKTKGNMV